MKNGYVQANGLKLHYLDYGTEGLPAILCVHGGAAHGHWYDFVAPGFSSNYHVRAIDLRGHGESEWAEPPSYLYHDYASDLAEAVEKLGLRDFVLMGHSMGGTVCLTYAATYPGRVNTLIVIDSSVNLSPDRVAKLRDIGTRDRQFATEEELVERYRLRPGDSLAAPEVVRHIAKHSGRRTSEGTWRYKFDRRVYATRELFDGMPYWDKIKVPALLVKGGLSDRINSEVFAKVKKHCPQAELAEVSNSYHHVTLDNPQEFVQKVNVFLANRKA